MAKEIDKIIQSKTAPKSNNVLWDDGENLKINRNGKWENANNTETGSLSIDPVVWKYIMNPFVLQTGRIVPDELIDSDGVSFKYHYDGMYRWAKGYAYDIDNFVYADNNSDDFGCVHGDAYGLGGAGNEIPPEGLPTSSSDINDYAGSGPFNIYHDNWLELFTTGSWRINKDTKQCYLTV